MRVIRTFGTNPFVRRVEQPIRIYSTAAPVQRFHNSHYYNQHHHPQHQEHFHDQQQQQQHTQSARHSEVPRYSDLVEEFDRLHRHFFRQFPMRRYVHSNLFREIDERFAEEFKRLQSIQQQQQQQQHRHHQHNTHQQQHPSQKVEAVKANYESSRNSNNSNTLNSQKTEKHREVNSALHESEFHSHSHPFFSSPFHMRNVEKTFEQERKRLQEMMEEFSKKTELGKAASPNVRTIHSEYRSSPEGVTHSYMDSKYPNRNFSFDSRKSANLEQEPQQNQSKETLNQAETLKQQSQKTETVAAEKESPVNQHTNQTINTLQQQNIKPEVNIEETARTSQKLNEEVPPQQLEESQVRKQEYTNPQNIEGRIEISPELNQKAKHLSIMLNKDYLESLELARVYSNKSVGQIIDLVLSSQTQY